MSQGGLEPRLQQLEKIECGLVFNRRKKERKKKDIPIKAKVRIRNEGIHTPPIVNL
jgi:hypothetical protein